MVERVKNLGFRDEVVGGRRSSGFTPTTPRQPLQSVFAGFEAIARNEKAEAIRAEREKEKALKAFLDTISVDYKTQLDVIEAESPRNPRAIVKKGTAYRQGVVNRAPPTLQPLISARIDNYLNLKRAKANKAATEEIQAQNDATEDRLSSRDFSILNEASAGIYSENVDVRNASEVEVQSLERELATRLFSQGVDDFGVPFDLLKKADITSRLQNFRDVSQSAAIKAWFREQKDPDKAYLQLKRGGFKVDLATFKKSRKDGTIEETFKQVNVMDAISKDGREKLFKDIASEIKSINDISIKEEKQETEDNQKSQRLNGFDNWDRILDPDPNEPPLIVEMIREQLAADLITKDDAVAQMKAINDPDPVEDDPVWVDVIERQTDLGIDFIEEINEGFVSGNLTAETAGALRTDNRTRLDKDLTSIEKAIDAARRDTLTDLNTGLKVNTLFTILDKDQGPRQVRARQELRRRIDEIKKEAPINTIEDVELFRDKLNRLNTEMIKTHRFKKRGGTIAVPPSVPALSDEQVTREKLKLGYETLNKQRQNGDITTEEFDKQAREILNLLEIEKNKNPESGGQ